MATFARLSRLLPLALVINVAAIEVFCAGLEVFASFENPAEVAAVRGSDGVKINASTRFPAWDANSLETVFPTHGGKIELTRIPADWRRQQSLLIYIWSLQPAELKLGLRDSQGGSFNQTVALRTGVNHFQLRLSRASALALGQMRSLSLETGRGGTFYFDYFALDRFHPVLQERGRWDIDYSMAVETPHVQWARPFAGGRIKLWALAEVADGRGIIELAQRLELDFKATSIGRRSGLNKWGFGDFYEHRASGGEDWKHAYSLAHSYIADDLLNGPDYDVILWPGIHPWESYPIEIRNEIRRRVERGAGLVLLYPNGSELGDISPLRPKQAQSSEADRSEWKRTSDHYITRGVPLEAFPWGQMRVAGFEAAGDVLLKTAQGAPVLSVNKLGRGRVVAFGYDERGMIPDIENVFETGLHYSYHEYLWSLVSRAVVWAAGREPQSAIRDLQLSANSLRVTLDHAPEGAEVGVIIRSSFDEFEAMERVPVKQQTATLTLPKPLSGGRHFADVGLIEKGRGIDWATRVFEVPAQATIRHLALESDRVKLGAPVNARVRVQAAGDCTITARLYDNYGRLLDERRYPVQLHGAQDAVEQTISLNSTGALTHLARVDCEVSSNDVRSDRRIQEVFVLQPRQWDDYDIVMYLFGPNPIPGVWPTIDAQLRKLDVTTLSSYTLQHSKHANYNIQAQTRISGQESPDGAKRAYYSAMKKKYFETHDKKVLVREYCLNDPAYRDLIRGELKKLTAPWVPFSPLSYYVYEEPSLTCYEDDLDLCFSTHCMTAMRGWLKGEYGTLAALNQQWGTGFANWEDVTPDDTYEAQARGNYASWADHRTFMEKTYAECFEFVLGELKKIDPQGILLNSGTQVSGAHNAADYSRLNQFTRHLNAYDGGNQLDFHRAFNPDLKISGGAGYGVLGRDVFYNFYGNLFKGSNGGAYVFWQYSTLDPDLTMSQSGKDMEQGFRELRGEGIGKLVGLAAPDNHGIAIHYSYPSIHGVWIVDGKIEEKVVYNPSSATMRRFNANRDGWVKVLHDAGLQFDFIGYGDVEKGGLTSKGYRTFILPMSVALSDEEVKAIRDFVSQGGTVIADALPGIMDKHCSFRAVRPLADVFGVQPSRSNRDDVVAMNGEPGLKLAGATPLLNEEGRPTLLEHRFGKGRAYLLNFFLDHYPEDRTEKRNAPVLEKVKRVLAAAEIHPIVRLTSASGAPVSDCDSYLFNNGTTRLLGLLPEKDGLAANKILIHFDKSDALYDVRQKRYLGAGSTFAAEIEPAVPRLFALLEGRIAGIELQSPASARRGEEVTIGFRIHGENGGENGRVNNLRSVAKVVVTDAAGREVQIYGGNRDVVEGAGTIRFRTALNDPAGLWRASVTEVISGERAQAEIRIQ
jgi:hypothetical protein